MEQLILHLFGDYITQNDNVATRKKEKSLTGLLYCLFHCITYSLPFLLITSWIGVLLIGIGHFILDRWNVVSYVIALKNGLYKEKKLDISNFGFIKDRPIYITLWLYIIQDNVIHIIWNYLVILLVVLI